MVDGLWAGDEETGVLALALLELSEGEGLFVPTLVLGAGEGVFVPTLVLGAGEGVFVPTLVLGAGDVTCVGGVAVKSAVAAVVKTRFASTLIRLQKSGSSAD